MEQSKDAIVLDENYAKAGQEFEQQSLEFEESQETEKEEEQ